MNASAKWTIAIVGLLAGNVSAQVALAMVANAGKSQVIPDYYDHAAHYDDAIDEAAHSAKLGWRVTAAIVDGSAEVRAANADGTPLEGAVVRVTGYPRAHADRTFDLSLAATAAIGTYRARVQDAAEGRYDLRVVVERKGEHFGTTFTVDTTASGR